MSDADRERVQEEFVRDGLPPFVIIADVALAEMAAVMPTSEAALLAISSVGRHKLRRFGSEFLDEIVSFVGR